MTKWAKYRWCQLPKEETWRAWWTGIKAMVFLPSWGTQRASMDNDIFILYTAEKKYKVLSKKNDMENVFKKRSQLCRKTGIITLITMLLRQKQNIIYLSMRIRRGSFINNMLGLLAMPCWQQRNFGHFLPLFLMPPDASGPLPAAFAWSS
jgi:hypothetical protein